MVNPSFSDCTVALTVSPADALLTELKCAYEFTAQEVAPVLVRICFPFSTEIEFLIISSLIKFM